MTKVHHFTAIVDKFDSQLWSHYFPVPDAIAQYFLEQKTRRVICTLQDKEQMHAALMPSGDGWFILLNKKIRTSLALDVGDEITVKLEEETSEYGMPMPEELQVSLDQDEEANAYFQALTPGKQRNLIYIVAKVKNMDSRINKSLAILHHLKEYEGKINFKALMATIKEYNNH